MGMDLRSGGGRVVGRGFLQMEGCGGRGGVVCRGRDVGEVGRRDRGKGFAEGGMWVGGGVFRFLVWGVHGGRGGGGGGLCFSFCLFVCLFVFFFLFEDSGFF